MGRAVRGKELHRAGHRAAQPVQHARNPMAWEFKCLCRDAGGFEFVAEDHLMRVFHPFGELNGFSHGEVRAMNLGVEKGHGTIEPAGMASEFQFMLLLYSFNFRVNGHFKSESTGVLVSRVFMVWKHGSRIPTRFGNGRLFAPAWHQPNQGNEYQSLPGSDVLKAHHGNVRIREG